MSAENPDDDPERAAAEAVSGLAARLQALRRAQGMPSFSELARRTGHPRSTLHDALRGDRLPSLEVTTAVAAACGGDGAEWHRRWTEVSRLVDAARGRPVDPVGRSRTPPDGVRRRPWWRRHPRATAVGAVGVLAIAVVAMVVLVRPGAATDCASAREYRVDAAGALLDAGEHTIGQVSTGDVVRVDSLAHDRFPHRRFGTVEGSGARGYVDESKLTFLRATCA